MKYLILFFLFSYGFSFEIPELTFPGLVKKIYRAGKAIKQEGSKPPQEVQQYIDAKWGTKIQETKAKWETLSAEPDTTKKDTTLQQSKETTAFQNTDIIIKEDDMLIHMKDDEIETFILWDN